MHFCALSRPHAIMLMAKFGHVRGAWYLRQAVIKSVACLHSIYSSLNFGWTSADHNMPWHGSMVLLRAGMQTSTANLNLQIANCWCTCAAASFPLPGTCAMWTVLCSLCIALQFRTLPYVHSMAAGALMLSSVELRTSSLP